MRTANGGMNGAMTLADNLDDITADLWVRLADAAASGKSAWHTPAVGTADGDLRVMVLRQTDPAAASLRFHTDARSPKAALIGGGAPVSLLFYDAAAKLQLRCTGIGQVSSTGAAADAAWAASAPSSRRGYLATLAPGTTSKTPTSGLPAAVEGRVPTLAESEAGRANFAVLTVTLSRIDWLHLAHDGHRRALFERDGDGWAGRWLVP